MNIATKYNEYEQSAINFLESTNTALTLEYKKHDYYFSGDKERRDIWTFKFTNANGAYSGTFGQSIANTGKKPTAYDIIACMTKYEPGSFDNFCGDFGYEEYDDDTGKVNKDSLRIYKAVCREFEGMSRLFTDEQLEAMQEIN